MFLTDLGLTVLSNSPIKFNPDLKPETVTSSEFGLELSMLSNKLNLDVTFYNIETEDLIFDVPVAASTGFTFNRTNIGLVSNKGLEIALGATLMDLNNLVWNTSLFYSKNENKVEDLTVDWTTLRTSSDNNIVVVVTVEEVLGIFMVKF